MNKTIAVAALLSVLMCTNSGYCQEETVQLKATIKKQEINLQSIRDLRLDLKRVRNSASAIFDEVTREPVSYTTAPNVVGSTIINPITITESSVLEPRGDWIVSILEKMGPTIELLRADVDSIEKDKGDLALSKTTEKEIDVLRSDWIILVKNIYDEYIQLNKAARTKPCDNVAVASRSQKIFRLTRRLEKTRRKAEKILLKELKQRKKDAKKR